MTHEVAQRSGDRASTTVFLGFGLILLVMAAMLFVSAELIIGFPDSKCSDTGAGMDACLASVHQNQVGSRWAQIGTLTLGVGGAASLALAVITGRRGQ